MSRSIPIPMRDAVRGLLLAVALCTSSVALADPGWLEIDVAGTTPRRVVTYADFGSFRLAHDAERAAALKNAPADSNTAALSRSLAQTRLWAVRVMRVFEGAQPVIELRDIHAQWLSVDCASGELFAISVERIRKDRKHPSLSSPEAETYETIATGRPLESNERWQSVLVAHACHQAPWRIATLGQSCLDERVQPLGMRCLSGIPDYDYLRIAAHHAMQQPAQAGAAE